MGKVFTTTEEVANKYIFRTDEGCYRNNLLQMGHKCAACIAHSTTQTLQLIAIKQSGFSTSTINYDCIIDDTIFLANERAKLEEVQRTYDELCRTCRVSLGEKTEIDSIIVYRGVEFDLTNKTQKIKEQTRFKISERYALFLQRPTKDRFISIIGSITYCFRILRFETFIPMMLAAAKILSQAEWENPTIANAMNDIMANKPVPIIRHDTLPLAGHVVSDATPKRIASIFIDSTGETHIAFRDFEDELMIHQREAQATILGLETIPVFEKTHRVIAITDNTSWLHTASNHKGVPTKTLAEYKMKIMQIEKAKNFQLVFQYIKSADNAADEISRGEQTTHQRIQHTLNNAQSTATHAKEGGIRLNLDHRSLP
jgi:hypothetical protein